MLGEPLLSCGRVLPGQNVRDNHTPLPFPPRRSDSCGVIRPGYRAFHNAAKTRRNGHLQSEMPASEIVTPFGEAASESLRAADQWSTSPMSPFSADGRPASGWPSLCCQPPMPQHHFVRLRFPTGSRNTIFARRFAPPLKSAHVLRAESPVCLSAESEARAWRREWAMATNPARSQVLQRAHHALNKHAS